MAQCPLNQGSVHVGGVCLPDYVLCSDIAVFTLVTGTEAR